MQSPLPSAVPKVQRLEVLGVWQAFFQVHLYFFSWPVNQVIRQQGLGIWGQVGMAHASAWSVGSTGPRASALTSLSWGEDGGEEWEAAQALEPAQGIPS